MQIGDSPIRVARDIVLTPDTSMQASQYYGLYHECHPRMWGSLARYRYVDRFKMYLKCSGCGQAFNLDAHARAEFICRVRGWRLGV